MRNDLDLRCTQTLFSCQSYWKSILICRSTLNLCKSLISLVVGCYVVDELEDLVIGIVNVYLAHFISEKSDEEPMQAFKTVSSFLICCGPFGSTYIVTNN